MSQTSHARNDLHNLARRLGYPMEWIDVPAGPQHQPTWHSTVYIRGIQYGSAYGPTVAAAREAAAQEAYLQLSQASGFT
ncbi:hypothetical protein FISHEDRAFT_75468 [Fistulina hepatica ATCC 64428]|uniref:DRBM domain-containing protein n=1 Tax=Fistulina hepatica ATCC 64428 TaxID=1128425 RepID=A0A0D7A760_9AGAR|nr:hypothetical protein FISHEDRAFT_75468 [Fistulina hepatica ATCC 64428]